MMASMSMLKRSDMWIADSGASNHVTSSSKGCINKRNATGLTHQIVSKSVHPQCELDKTCVHYDKDGNQVGKVIITDVSHLLEEQKTGWTLTGNAEFIKLTKGENSLLFNIVVNTPKGALYMGEFSRKEGDKVMGRAADKAPSYSIKKTHELLEHNNENDKQVI
jgi:hypothetical protein